MKPLVGSSPPAQPSSKLVSRSGQSGAAEVGEEVAVFDHGKPPQTAWLPTTPTALRTRPIAPPTSDLITGLIHRQGRPPPHRSPRAPLT